MIINILLLFVCSIVYNPISACEYELCIIDSTCGDDYIHFNISMPKDCQHPLHAYFSYDTDIDSERHYLNKTFPCDNCYFDLTIDSIHDAWDYTLTFESPKPKKSCSVYKAHCGGNTSRYVWIGTFSLSGLFILFGFLLCTIRYCRTRQELKSSRKTIEVPVINS
jgi:hypothetical protein